MEGCREGDGVHEIATLNKSFDPVAERSDREIWAGGEVFECLSVGGAAKCAVESCGVVCGERDQGDVFSG